MVQTEVKAKGTQYAVRDREVIIRAKERKWENRKTVRPRNMVSDTGGEPRKPDLFSTLTDDTGHFPIFGRGLRHIAVNEFSRKNVVVVVVA